MTLKNFISAWILFYTTLYSQNNLGKVEQINFYSNLNNAEYNIYIYTPPSYDVDTARYPSVYFQDGSGYLSNIRANQVIDNLVNSGQMSKVIGVFIDPNDRTDEYLFNGMKNYAHLLAVELAPYIDSVYRTQGTRQSRMVIGVSYGGNISANISYTQSEVFGLCGLQSAAFRPTYDVFRRIVNGKAKPIRFYATWGTNERPIHTDMRIFRDSLLAKGYDFVWEESSDSHTWSAWSKTLPNILTHFFPAELTGIDESRILTNFYLYQNYPNPFNPTTTIQFAIPKAGEYKVIVYNILGEQVTELLNTQLQPGVHRVEFGGSNLASGIYIYQLVGNSVNFTKKMILMK